MSFWTLTTEAVSIRIRDIEIHDSKYAREQDICWNNSGLASNELYVHILMTGCQVKAQAMWRYIRLPAAVRSLPAGKPQIRFIIRSALLSELRRNGTGG